jgi:hypothetical protein
MMAVIGFHCNRALRPRGASTGSPANGKVRMAGRAGGIDISWQIQPHGD